MTEGLKLDDGKLDDGKLDYSLVDPAVEAEMVAVLTYGAAKYERGNWRKVEGARDRYFAALRRHLAAWQSGEHVDGETELHHLAHAACCLHFLLGIELSQGNGPLWSRTLPERLARSLDVAQRIRAAREAKRSSICPCPHHPSCEQFPECGHEPR